MSANCSLLKEMDVMYNQKTSGTFISNYQAGLLSK